MRGWKFVVCVYGCGGLAAIATTARAENEFVSHSVETYGSTGMCSGDPLSNPHMDAYYYDDGFTGYDQFERWHDAAVDGRDFTDYGYRSWGEDDVDPYGTDFADAIFFSGHAGASCTSGSERVWLTMGDASPDPCTIYLAHVTSGSRNMQLGGSTTGEEADGFSTYACQTTQYCVYTAGAYSALSTGQFNILNGFHGLVYEVSGYQTDLSNYSGMSRFDGIGDSWLDYMYDDGSTTGFENCPSSILWGANSSETADYYTYGGWFDFHDNGARSVTNFYRICGCDPDGGTALPSC